MPVICNVVNRLRPSAVEKLDYKGGLAMAQFGEVERNFKYLNKSMTRVDSASKASGRANYASDLSFAGMLHAGALYSSHASAKVLSIDTTKAQAVPGCSSK